MKYLCLIYNQEKNLDGLSKAQWAALEEEYVAFTEGIRATGHHLGGEGLQPTASARTVRVRNGRSMTTLGSDRTVFGSAFLGGLFVAASR